EAVGDAGRDEDALARPRDHLLTAEAEAHLAGDDLEALLLVRVHVRRGDLPARRDERLHQHVVAIGLGARPVEDEALARHHVDDLVAGLDAHDPLLARGTSAASGRTSASRTR